MANSISKISKCINENVSVNLVISALSRAAYNAALDLLTPLLKTANSLIKTAQNSFEYVKSLPELSKGLINKSKAEFYSGIEDSIEDPKLKKIVAEGIEAADEAIINIAGELLAAETLTEEFEANSSQAGNEEAVEAYNSTIGGLLNSAANKACSTISKTASELPPVDPVTGLTKVLDVGMVQLAHALPKISEEAATSTSSAINVVKEEKNIREAIVTSPQKQNEVIQDINDKVVAGAGAPEARAYRRRFRYMGPIADAFTANLELFQPVSEQMGANAILFAPDTYSLDIEEWSKDFRTTIGPQPTRSTMTRKLKSKALNMIADAYVATNKLQVNNLPNEYAADENGLIVKRPPNNLAHGFHLAGDDLYSKMFGFSPAGTPNLISGYVAANLGTYLGPAIKLVDHQVPVLQSQSVGIEVDENKNKPFVALEESVEKSVKPVAIDLKGNKIVGTPTTVNNDVLHPSKEELV